MISGSLIQSATLNNRPAGTKEDVPACLVKTDYCRDDWN